MNEIIWSALARAQKLYPVDVCGLNFERNHGHLALMVQNPEMVPLFIGYVKQETAQAINHLLGRRRRTVWAEDYDSPTVLDSDKALEKIAYLLLNPVKDNQASSLDEYPGVSSWKLFKGQDFTRKCRFFHRDDVPRLKNPHCPWLENKRVLEALDKDENSPVDFCLSPYVWKTCFEDTENLTDEQVRELILERIEAEARKLIEENKSKKLPTPKPEELQRQSMLTPYVPKTFGKRMLCLSSIKELRVVFIAGYKRLRDKAEWVLSQWRLGNWLLPFPPGLFPPCLPRRANLLPDALWA